MSDAEVMHLPAPYLQFDDFLDAQSVERLVDFVRAHEGDLTASGVLAAPGDEKKEVRRSRTMYELDEIWPLFDAQLHGLLPTLRRELEVPWFQVDHVERQLTVHHDGDFFGVHNDSGGEEVGTRMLTYVYYFNIDPKQFDGGELWVYDFYDEDYVRQKGDAYVALEPKHNSIVFFPSWVHHEVRPVRSKVEGIEGCRMTVNGWFHMPRVEHEPPAEELASIDESDALTTASDD